MRPGKKGGWKTKRKVWGSRWNERKWGTALSPGSLPLGHSEYFAISRKKMRRRVNKINYVSLTIEGRFLYFLPPISSKLKPVYVQYVVHIF